MAASPPNRREVWLSSQATEPQGGPEGPTGPFPLPPRWILRVGRWDVTAGPCSTPRTRMRWADRGADAQAFPLQLRGRATQQIPQAHLATQLLGPGRSPGHGSVPRPLGQGSEAWGAPSGLSLPGHLHPPVPTPPLFRRKEGPFSSLTPRRVRGSQAQPLQTPSLESL